MNPSLDRLLFYVLSSRYAIKGSPNQKLLLEDIYYAIESRVRPADTSYPQVANKCLHVVPLFPNRARRVEGEPLSQICGRL